MALTGRIGLRGSLLLPILLTLVAISVLALLLVYLAFSGGEDTANAPLITTVVRGPFRHIVLEHGEVESSRNLEIQCEVKARNSSGTAIIWVIDEGTLVKKGDKLVELDSSALVDEKQSQSIAVNTSRAAKISAERDLLQATIARKEYLEGTFLQEEQLIDSEILFAEEKLSRAQETAKFSRRLAALGFQTAQQLEADLFAVKQAQVELNLAKERLRTLREITKEKMLVGFDSDIKAASAILTAETESFDEEVKKLEEIEEQIRNCLIYAPEDGQVVHANISNRRGGSSEFVVEAGAMVRERQAIVRLPDPGEMQVKATINESRITYVMENMPVEIYIGAFGDDRMLAGVVKKVNKYAEPGSWFSSQVKEYAVFVEILDPPPDLRTGMTAEVRIEVDRKKDVLQIPVQSFYEHKGHFFSLIKNGDGWKTLELQMDTTDDKFIVILTAELIVERYDADGDGQLSVAELQNIPVADRELIGIREVDQAKGYLTREALVELRRKSMGVSELTVGTQVVLNPREHVDKFMFPDLPDVAPKRKAGQGKGRGGKKGKRRPRQAGSVAGRDSGRVSSLANGGNVAGRSEPRMTEAGNGAAHEAEKQVDGSVDRAESTTALDEPSNVTPAGGTPAG